MTTIAPLWVRRAWQQKHAALCIQLKTNRIQPPLADGKLPTWMFFVMCQTASEARKGTVL
jgi:hypothetical protein